MRRQTASAPAAAMRAIEQMMADAFHQLHRARPGGTHVIGMVMRRRPDLLQPDLAGGHGERHVLRYRVLLGAGDAVLDPVAGERELAAIAPAHVLVDDAAD